MIVLLVLDVLVAWMVIQGAYTYLGMVWHGLAGEALPRGTIEAHGRQFLALRWIQVGVWSATIALFLTWLHRARSRGVSGLPAWVGWWGGLVAAAALGHVTVMILAADRSRPLDLGGPLQLLVLTELVEIGAAVLAILVVRRAEGRSQER